MLGGEARGDRAADQLADERRAAPRTCCSISSPSQSRARDRRPAAPSTTVEAPWPGRSGAMTRCVVVSAGITVLPVRAVSTGPVEQQQRRPVTAFEHGRGDACAAASGARSTGIPASSAGRASRRRASGGHVGLLRFVGRPRLCLRAAGVPHRPNDPISRLRARGYFDPVGAQITRARTRTRWPRLARRRGLVEDVAHVPVDRCAC